MNIGSKVRLLHGREEGIITKISGNYVEVDLGDGFGIPMLASEVVVVSPMEAQLVKTPASQEVRKSPHRTFSKKGIYLVFVPINDREIVLHLVNLTDWKILFTLYGRSDNQITGLASGMLESEKSQQITKLLWKDFEKWPVFDTHLLYYSETLSPEQPSLHYSLRCRPQSFHKRIQKAPLLEVKGHVYQIDLEESSAPAVSPAAIRESMLEVPVDVNVPLKQPQRVPSQIDLHADSLDEVKPGMSSDEILLVQLSVFKAYLEKAIVGGLENVTFIHGVGQGKLRQEIHRLLSKHPNVAYYKDAQKEKFGYGATIAHLQ